MVSDIPFFLSFFLIDCLSSDKNREYHLQVQLHSNVKIKEYKVNIVSKNLLQNKIVNTFINKSSLTACLRVIG